MLCKGFLKYIVKSLKDTNENQSNLFLQEFKLWRESMTATFKKRILQRNDLSEKISL